MKRLTKHIILGTWLCVIAFLASCSSGGEPQENTSQGESVLTLTMTASRANSSEGQYEVGTIYENFIDATGGDYRIYFFDNNNKFIARCMGEMTTTNTTDYTTYKFNGYVPTTLRSLSTFKIVVLANWETYADDQLIAGTTTIADVVSASWAQFSCDTNSTQEIVSGTRHIPFFGVRSFSGVTFDEGKTTTLTDPITLLRAVAKVEVLKDDTEDDQTYSFSSVSLINYSATGYCAPLVSDKSDYDHDYTWSEDFVRQLHLVSGEEKADTLSLYQENTSKWIIYIPEYRNLTTDGTALRTDGKVSVIDVKVNFKNEGATEDFKLFIASYEDNEVKEYYNVERNNIYRYKIKIVNGRIKVYATQWTNTFDNIFDFGTVDE